MREPWDKQPGEGDVAFQAFAEYRDRGPERSLPAVAHLLGRTEDLMEAWSVKNNWVERASSYDVYLDRKRRQALERRAIDEAEALAVAGSYQNARGSRLLQKVTDVELEALSPEKKLDSALALKASGRADWKSAMGLAGMDRERELGDGRGAAIVQQQSTLVITGEAALKIQALMEQAVRRRAPSSGDNGGSEEIEGDNGGKATS